MESSSYTFSSRRFAIGTALTLFFLVVIGLGQHQLMMRLDLNDAIARSISENPMVHGEYEIVFLGDSRCHQGLDPRAFRAAYADLCGREPRTYNLGRPGMQAPFFYIVTRDYIENVGRAPRAMVLNVSFYLLEESRWLNDVYISYYTPTKLWQGGVLRDGGILDTKGAVAWYFHTRIPQLRYRKRSRGILDTLGLTPEKLSTEAQYNTALRADMGRPETFGYMSRGTSHIRASDVDVSMYKTGKEAEVNLYFLSKLFELAKQHQMKILVYDFPWPDPAKSDEFMAVKDYYRHRVKELAKGNECIVFVDHECFWPVEVFVDPLHLNQHGADWLSARAARWIADVEAGGTVVHHSGYLAYKDSSKVPALIATAPGGQTATR